MTSEPANVLIAGLCLVALVLAGGATQALVPGDPNVELVIGTGGTGGAGFECPPNRVVIACPDFNRSPRQTIDLFQSVRDLFVIEGVSITSAGPDGESGETDAASATTSTTTSGTPSGTSTASESAGSSGSPTPGAIRPNSEEESQSDEADPSGTPTEAAPATGGAGGPSLDWLLWPAIVVLGVAAAAGLVVGLRRRGSGSPGQLRRLPGLALDTLLSAVVRVAAAATRYLQALWAGVIRTITRLGTVGSLLTDEPLARRFSSAIDALVGGVASVVRQLLERVPWPRGGAPEGPPPRADETAATVATPPAEGDVRDAWRWLARRTGGDAGHRTPDDIARAAIERGYPRDAVRALLRAFHDVTYGEYPPTDERRRAARDAVKRLRQAERVTEGGRP